MIIKINPPVGRGTPKAFPLVVLTPTKNQTSNKLNDSKQNKYANICRNRDIPTYGCFEAFWRKFYFIQTQLNGAMAIAPYGFLLNLKHYNLTYLSQKLFFNVKIVKKYRNTLCQ